MGKQRIQQNRRRQLSQSEENLQRGMELISSHTLFGNLLGWLVVKGRGQMGQHAALTDKSGSVYLNRDVLLTEKQWVFVIAHGLLHLAFGHFDAERMPGYVTASMKEAGIKHGCTDPFLWNMACDIYIDRFLTEIKFGESLCDPVALKVVGGSDECAIYQKLKEAGREHFSQVYGTAAVGSMDMQGLKEPIIYREGEKNRYVQRFSDCLNDSVTEAVELAAGRKSRRFRGYMSRENGTLPGFAARWFIGHYPLLGGLAASFEILSDRTFCQKHEISIAAIDVEQRRIYVNPLAEHQYSEQEWRFILAHEYLHAGLKHRERCQGRDFYLWNIACDYVINGWLCEMQVGVMPKDGLLYDPELKGMSAEGIYDLLLGNLSRYARFDTFRGYQKGDILLGGVRKMGGGDGVSVDDICYEALRRGLEYWEEKRSRSLLPAGLIEEIRVLAMPPIPWDVALAEWFDCLFEPLDQRRSYARPSRRQASTPDIPRPRYIPAEIPVHSRTFGVVLDTSGSMSVKEIGKALGSIASYAAAKDVPLVRVVFCDAAAYDAGYLSPEDVAGEVAVKGGGGTSLQPGIDLLETAKDFPKDGPILIITDGEIEAYLDITHTHAYLLPKGRRLPFRAKGKVFYFENVI